MDRLREFRVVKRFTQFHLTVITGIHQSRISLIENGWVKARDDEKKRLANALGVRPDDIWSRDKSENASSQQAELR